MIDCGRCDMRGAACQDCVVTVMAPRIAARHLGAEELRALSVLADAGMVPPLRLSTKPTSLRTPRNWAYPAAKAS
jgi:protein gp37